MSVAVHESVTEARAMYPKLERWRIANGAPNTVSIARAVDLTVLPSSARASFPYPSLPPFRILGADDILRELVQIPNIFTTSIGSFLFGLALGAVALIGPPRRRPSPTARVVAARTLRMALMAVVLLIFRRFMQKRAVQVIPASRYENVSGNPCGVCCVTSRVVSVSNSHAGTHADQPPHYIPSSTAQFPNECYTGLATVVNVSAAIAAHARAAPADEVRSGRALGITAAILQETLAQCRLDPEHVWRLLLVTTALDADGGADQSSWRPAFSFLSPDGVQYLARSFPNLFLVGLDTPSVDHPTCSPLHENAHGILFDSGIAIMENLCFTHLLPRLRRSPCVCGSMLTVFNPMQVFPDSKGCSVLFFPCEPEREHVE